MATLKKEIKVEVGVPLRGYGTLNSYGEWTFVPEQTGSRAGRIKKVKDGDCYTLSSSKEKVIIHITIPRASALDLIKSFMGVVDNLINDFRTYEF